MMSFLSHACFVICDRPQALWNMSTLLFNVTISLTDLSTKIRPHGANWLPSLQAERDEKEQSKATDTRLGRDCMIGCNREVTY